MALDIRIGEEIRRRALHEKYGGNPQSGISSSRTTPVIMCFTDPKKGALYGYRDGWGNDGLYHYTGEGQLDDQTMTRGNRAIHDHAANGKEIHLFKSVRTGIVSYKGQFKLPTTESWYRGEAPDKLKIQRSVIIFQLAPLESEDRTYEPHIAHTPALETSVSDVPPEDFRVLQTVQKPNREPTEIHRRESQLLATYRTHLENRGHHLSRKKITPNGERGVLFTDLYDQTDDLLIEAKSQATRECIRMAIGQLFDYQRYIRPRPKLAILVPSPPRKDLRELCTSLSIRTIWPAEDGSGYRTEPNSEFHSL